MIWSFKTFCIWLTMVGASCALARADGGVVRWSEKRDGVELTVFTSPNPLRAGPVDVSVLVQNAETGEAIMDADVQVRLTPRNRSQEAVFHAVATQAEATNKLLQASLFELPAPGWWDVEVECTTASGTGTRTSFARFSMEAEPPLPRWLAVWPWFTWPLAAILLFGVHRGLSARQHTTRK